MPLRVQLSPRARADLKNIAGWVAQADEGVAFSYADRVYAACEKLLLMPHGGTPRDRFGTGFRSVLFERKLLILYRVEKQTLVIKRILLGRRMRGRGGRMVRRRS